jgi:hypothetical protein
LPAHRARPVGAPPVRSASSWLLPGFAQYCRALRPRTPGGSRARQAPNRIIGSQLATATNAAAQGQQTTVHHRSVEHGDLRPGHDMAAVARLRAARMRASSRRIRAQVSCKGLAATLSSTRCPHGRRFASRADDLCGELLPFVGQMQASVVDGRRNRKHLSEATPANLGGASFQGLVSQLLH